MFSFQGDFRRQRNINLGGRRRNDTARDTAQAVLSRAHDERQKREKQRREHTAALAIQRLFTTRHSTALWRQRLRDGLDVAVIEDPRAPDEALFGSLAEFAVYCNGSAVDIDRLHAILRSLFLADAAQPRYWRIVAHARATGAALGEEKWQALALRLFASALAAPGPGMPRVDASLVLDSLASGVRVDLAQGQRPELLCSLIESRGLYAFLSRCLASDQLPAASVESAVLLAVAPADSAALGDAAMPYFVRWILSIPGLPSRIGVHGVTAISKAHIDWCRVTRHICDEIARLEAAGGALQLTAISMLGNMAAFVLPQLSRQGPLTPIDRGFIEAAAACALVVPSCDLLGAKRPFASGTRAAAATAAEGTALKWMNNVLSVDALCLLVRASCSSSDKAHAQLAQRLLLVFIQRWGKAARSTVIDSIFQAVDIRTVGWRAVLSDSRLLEQLAGDMARVDAIKSHDLAQLQLLCALLSRQLETIGDDELFQQGMSLPLADIRTIARVCRNIAFALHWAHGYSDNDTDLGHLRDAAAALTQQLFALNARHPFVGEDFWLVPPSLLDMASFADKVAEDPMFSVEDRHPEDSASDTSSSDGDISSDESDAEAGMSRAGVRAPDSRLEWMAHTYSSIARRRSTRVNEQILTPRIAVLRSIPFVVPFNDRVRLFHALVNRDRARLGISPIGRASGPAVFSPFTAARAVVKRGTVFDDGFNALFPVLTGKPASSTPADGAMDDGHAAIADLGGAGFDEPFSEFDEFDLAHRQHRPLRDADGTLLSQRDMFKYRMQIAFVDEHGMLEAGIDGGGVFKEFLTSLVREAFDPRMGLFSAARSNSIYPNPEAVLGDAEQRRRALDRYRFLGAVIGKALYEGVLVDAPLALFFLGYCVGKLPEFNDLPTLDEALYRGLVALKNYPVQVRPGAAGDDDEIYRVFGLDFTTTVSLPDGQTRTVPLVPRGDTIRVT
ncbi:ubiquitin-protein ligase (E3), partial [Coemansia spiralis]